MELVNRTPLGFRWWRLSEGDTPRLRAWVWDVDWNVPGVTSAFHRRPDGDKDASHLAPGHECQCGIYGWWTLDSTRRGIEAYPGTVPQTISVVGAFIAGGELCLHGSEGFRCAQARPVAFGFANNGDRPPLLRDLAERFGAPLLSDAKLESYCREFGESLADLALTA